MAEAAVNDPNLPANEVNSGETVAAGGEAQVNQQVQDETQNLAGVDILKHRYTNLGKGRQVQLLLALAATVTVIAVVLLWATAPNFKKIYGNLSEKTAGEVIEVLEQENISYELDSRTGDIKVPPEQIHEVRIMLAGKGLPRSEGTGFEMLDEGQGFGTSQFMEKARYFRAIEGELARSITKMDNVEFARVHLAIPKQSVFIRDRREPSASVLVKLSHSASLSENQISAIVHMVASSIPDLNSDKVTVVDHKGKMLTKRDMPGDMALSSAQFDYKSKLEQNYIQRIERILTPIVGYEGVRAQVDANIDFSVTESTQESFNPDLPAVRSEQVMEEESRGGDVGGVPGALTNQPPGAANSPEKIAEGEGGRAEAPSRKSKKSTFNYELDKTISHTRKSPGSLKRLSVGVVIDDRVTYDTAGKTIRTPLTPEEVNRISALVKEAVGFSIQRGDTLSVVNESFHSVEPPPEPTGPVWEQPWFIEIAKQGAGVVMALILISLLLRPVLRDLTRKDEPEEEDILEGELDEEENIDRIERSKRDAGGLTAEEWAELGISAEEYQDMLNRLRQLVTEDPRLVAQVTKTWLAQDDMADREARKKDKKKPAA